MSSPNTPNRINTSPDKETDTSNRHDDSNTTGSSATYITATDFIRIPIDTVLPKTCRLDVAWFCESDYKLLESNFETFLGKRYYVNKADFVNFCINSGSALYFMPPGTGKTVLCYLLHHFLSKKTPLPLSNSISEKFRDDKIELMLDHFTKYNVIHLDMENFASENIESVQTFQNRILKMLKTELVEEFPYLMDCFEQYGVSDSLQYLFRDIATIISKHENSKSVILLDNVEAPVNWMISKTCKLSCDIKKSIAAAYLVMIRQLFSRNSNIFLTICFGVHEPYNLYAAESNFVKRTRIYTISSPELKTFSKFFFFTSGEVEKLLNQSTQNRSPTTSSDSTPPHTVQQLRTAYGGYCEDLFLPESIILSIFHMKGIALFQTTERNGVMLIAERELSSLLTYFLCEEAVTVATDFAKSYENIFDESTVAYAYFVRAGILKIKEKFGDKVKLEMINDETKNLAAIAVETNIQVAENLSQLNLIETALQNENAEVLEENINHFLYTYALKELTKEKDYHVVLHTFILCAAGRSFKFPSAEKEGGGNKKSGRSGYCDLFVGARDKSIFYAIELKVRKKKTKETEESIDNSVTVAKELAFKQIGTRGYIGEKYFSTNKKVNYMAVVCSGKKIFVFIKPAPKPEVKPLNTTSIVAKN